MITILRQPTGIVLDSDNLDFMVRSNRTDTTFVFQSNIEGAEFVNFPKYNANTSNTSLKNVFKNKEVTVSSIHNYIKKLNNLFTVNANIVEYLPSSGVGGSAIEPFDILFSTKSIEHMPLFLLFGSKVAFLGISKSITAAPKCKLSIPFFVQNTGMFSFTLSDNENHYYHSFSVQLSKGYYVFEDEFSFNFSVDNLVFKITEGVFSISKNIRVLRHTANQPLNVQFTNQFGAVISCQLFGARFEDEELKYKTYENQNGTLYNSDVDGISTLTVETGYLLPEEMFLITQILYSKKVEIEINGTFKHVVCSTKKYRKWENNTWLLGNKLTFQFKNYEAN